MRALASILVWTVVSALGAVAFGALALHRGESINAAWLLTAALCTYAVGYRFYSRLIARRVFALDDARATPAVRRNDGHDYVPTHPAVAFGHHFAAIAGAGPLVGPILAAQFGYLPGAIWIIVGVVLGGAAQDFVILCGSMRRDGKSLGQMAREEIGPVGGWMALFGVFAIIIILTAVLAMVVVNALAESPWGVVSIGLTIPTALLMGAWMRWIRPGRVLEASAIGIVLLAVALLSGKWVADDAALAPVFTLKREPLALMLIVYGFAASVLPVWLLLAPRDYLSAFVKVGTVFLLAAGIFIVLPDLKMPAIVAQFGDGGVFADGKGPVTPGTLFPFAFITIACGSISGFHALVSSGTTPKLLAKESHARFVGYGSMLMESFVATMALIAACALTPGLYFAMNAPAAKIGVDPAAAATAISSWGFVITPGEIEQAASDIGEKTILSRAGGAPCLAVGMAQIFAQVFPGPVAMKYWYHFAIMFEALFILTTIDAGTRVGRFILQDLVGHAWPRFGDVSWKPAAWIASAVVAGGWGWFLVQGVRDPLGGIYTLWPVFGIANQVLAAIALCVGTAIIVRMGRARFAFVTIIPLLWLIVVTETAGWQKLRSPDPAVGFLAKIHTLEDQVAKLSAEAVPDTAKIAGLQRQAMNQRIDAFLCAAFMAAILVVALDTARECAACLSGGRLRGSAPRAPEPQPSEAELREA
jgi:carbon starvation protein